MHEGHRSRLVGKIKNGDNLYEHELLEVLLFNACPRKDVNYIAHSLIDEFGDIRGVLQADESRLVEVDGIGKSMAEYLVCLGKCLKHIGGSASFFVAHSTEQFKQFISARFSSFNGDRLELFCLDKDGRIRRICNLLNGRERGERVSADDILKIISVYKPFGLYAARYRGEGDSLPSDEDDCTVATIKFACSLSGVRLYDYCIAARGEEVFSYGVADRLESHFTERNLLKPGKPVQKGGNDETNRHI